MSEKKDHTWLIILLGFVVILGAVGFIYYHSMNTTPQVKIPNAKMPSPNAFDYYVDAGNMVNQEKAISFAAMNPKFWKKPTSQPDPLYKIYTLKEKEALLTGNSAALARMRQGFAYEFRNPPIRSIDTGLPYLAKFRALGRLLQLEGQVKAAHGDWNGAMDSYLDALKLGEDEPRGGNIIEMRVGNVIGAFGRQDAWEAIDHLTADQAKAKTIRLEDIMSHHVQCWEVLQEEKWMTQAVIVEMMNKPDWHRVLHIYDSNLSGDTPIIGQLLYSIRFTRHRVMANFTGYMDQCIDSAKQPYASSGSLPPDVPKDPICLMFAPSLTDTRFDYVNRNETQNALLLASLAIRAYKADHGRYPAKLSDLVPTYLKKLPDDPFTPNAALKYRLNGNKYVLYSIGPDGKDNGGKPICDPQLEPARRYSVYTYSDGDIVAGVNIY
jgi:hypothetical protein